MKRRSLYTTDVLRIDFYLTMPRRNATRLTPDFGCEFLTDVFPYLSAALALGFLEDDKATLEAFGYLQNELLTLHDAATTAWSEGRTVRLAIDCDDPTQVDFADRTLDLARVLACRHLGRGFDGAHEHGFDLLADLLVHRLAKATQCRPRKLFAIAGPALLQLIDSGPAAA